MKRLAIVMMFASGAANAQNNSLPETQQSVIEYRSVAEALAGLRSKPGTEMSVQGKWTIAYESAAHVIWSFAPEDHPAYPAVVKRAVVVRDGKTMIDMGVICQASKSACDGLVREFIQMNENMRSSFKSGQ